MISYLDGGLPQERGVDAAITSAVLDCLDMNKMFLSLNKHMIEVPATDNHVVFLIKTVAKCYAKIRLHHMAKMANLANKDKKIRRKFTNLILFKNQ